MSNIAIRVEHVSKRYRLGEREPYKSLRDVIARTAAAPIGWLRRKGQPSADNGAGYFWALDNVSFEIKQGQAVGVIGRNGAGKSTLLKILSRITKPTKGQARIYGRVGSLLEVGTGFHPELTGRENIYLNGAILGMKRREIERKFDEIVAFAEIEKFLDTPVKRYSSGMYVRLAFAVAAHLEPEILLVDEVLAVGDAGFQKKCLGKMGDVANEGRTVLFVSHNMAAVNQLCPNCILLQKGMVLLIDKTPNVIDCYLKDSKNSHFNPSMIDTNDLTLMDLKIYQEGIIDPGLFITELPTIVEFVYEVEQEVYGLRIGFDLVSKEGITVFRTFDDDIKCKLTKSPGRYKAFCIIPKSLLAPTNYFLYPRIGIHNVRWIYNGESGIEITLHNQNGVNSRYADYRPGVIMPGLDWRIVKND